MTTSTALRPPVRAAFTGLIDYAGLFPPAKLPMAQAAAEYRSDRAGAFAWMLGRFIVPDRALRTLPADVDGPFSVIVQRDIDAFRSVEKHRARGVRIEALEIALPQGGAPFRKDITASELDEAIAAVSAEIGELHDLPAYLEIPRGPWWSELFLRATMKALQTSGFGAKIRCGGLTADAFPGVDDVAAFINSARSANVPFKATAGLHHPVRHLDAATGFTMHGFLNILAAAALASRVNRETLVRIVAEEDATAFGLDDDALSWRNERITTAELQRVRRDGFVGYGSCSFGEPVDDLIALGMLPPR